MNAPELPSVLNSEFERHWRQPGDAGRSAIDRLSCMSVKQKRNLVWWILVLYAIAVVVMLIISYRGWNARNRPPMVAGSWYLDDLRTDEEENSLVTFSSSGEFDGDSTFGVRWSYRDGKIFFRTWRLEDESQFARVVTNTTLYSWIAETDEFPLTAEFSDDGSVLTLIAEDEGPRCRLRRANP